MDAEPAMAQRPRAEIGVIGGSGLYTFLDDAVEVPIDTPYGPPSDAPVIGAVGDRSVAFLPRHGRDHPGAVPRGPHPLGIPKRKLNGYEEKEKTSLPLYLLWPSLAAD